MASDREIFAKELFAATKKGDVATFKNLYSGTTRDQLIEDLRYVLDDNYRNALILAIVHKQYDLVKHILIQLSLLLEDNPSKFELIMRQPTGLDDSTPFKTACANGVTRIVKLFREGTTYYSTGCVADGYKLEKDSEYCQRKTTLTVSQDYVRDLLNVPDHCAQPTEVQEYLKKPLELTKKETSSAPANSLARGRLFSTTVTDALMNSLATKHSDPEQTFAP